VNATPKVGRPTPPRDVTASLLERKVGGAGNEAPFTFHLLKTPDTKWIGSRTNGNQMVIDPIYRLLQYLIIVFN